MEDLGEGARGHDRQVQECSCYRERGSPEVKCKGRRELVLTVSMRKAKTWKYNFMQLSNSASCYLRKYGYVVYIGVGSGHVANS